jgi:hypothetical protein
VSADELHAWSLPEGWFTVVEVMAGPRADGRFEVRWAHQEETTWEYASTLQHSIPFRVYCEQRRFDMAELARQQTLAAGSRVGAVREAAGTVGQPVVVAPRCPVCKRPCLLNKDGKVDGRHNKGCVGTGQKAETQGGA